MYEPITKAIDREIKNLTAARDILKKKPVASVRPRVLSAEARKRISDAQKKRWAKYKKAA